MFRKKATTRAREEAMEDQKVKNLRDQAFAGLPYRFHPTSSNVMPNDNTGRDDKLPYLVDNALSERKAHGSLDHICGSPVDIR
jgi:hypothetical protein